MTQVTIDPNFLLDLQLRLEAHTPRGSHEVACHQQMRQALFVDYICSSAHFKPGHFTASMFVVSPTHTEVLLIWHERLQLWVQPGGHLDKEDTTILSAALREVKEETTLTQIEPFYDDWTILDLDIHQFPASLRKNQPSHKHYDVRFWGRAQQLQIKASNEVKKAEWVPLDEVTSIQTDQSVRRACLRIRSNIAHKLN